jgi:hypothetical protein
LTPTLFPQILRRIEDARSTTLVASIRKRPGEGNNARLALLSVAEVKRGPEALHRDDDGRYSIAAAEDGARQINAR